MRIFYVSQASAKSSTLVDSKIWDINLRHTLLDMGHKLIVPSFDADQMMRECSGHVPGSDPQAVRTKYSELLVEDVRRAAGENRVDLFFSYLYSKHVFPDAIDLIRRHVGLTINFYCNSI